MPKQMSLWEWAQLGSPGAFLNEVMCVVKSNKTHAKPFEITIFMGETRTLDVENVWEIGRLFRCRPVDIQGWFEIQPKKRKAG